VKVLTKQNRNIIRVSLEKNMMKQAYLIEIDEWTKKN
jgi:hypothetical protein